MAQSRFIITGILISILASEALAMNCPIVSGVSLSCPISSDSAAAFCCTGPLSVPYCCDANEYIKENPGILAGIIIGVLILVFLPVLCCICCFCACCPIYQRRVNRGAVIYRY